MPRSGTCSLTSVIETASSDWAKAEASMRMMTSYQKVWTKNVMPVNSAAAARQIIHIRLRPSASIP